MNTVVDDALATSLPDDDDRECPVCGAEDGSYVRYRGDTVCSRCGHVPTPSNPDFTTETPWEDWWKRRRANDDYDGWYGEDRIRMIGGFIGAYDY